MQVDEYLKKSRSARGGRFKKIFWTIFIAAAIFGSGWVFWRSPLVLVKAITIEGERTVNEEDVVNIINKYIGRSAFRNFLGENNILAWPDGLSESDIPEPSRIKKLDIKKNFGGRSVLVQVEERRPLGIWCVVQAEKCYWFDEGGLLFEEAPSPEGNIVYGVSDLSASEPDFASPVLPHTELVNLFSILNVLREAKINVAAIIAEDTSLKEIKVRTVEGPNIYFSLRFPADNALLVLRSLKGEFPKFDYVDFRVENRAYYK